MPLFTRVKDFSNVKNVANLSRTPLISLGIKKFMLAYEKNVTQAGQHQIYKKTQFLNTMLHRKSRTIFLAIFKNEFIFEGNV